MKKKIVEIASHKKGKNSPDRYFTLFQNNPVNVNHKPFNRKLSAAFIVIFIWTITYIY